MRFFVSTERAVVCPVRSKTDGAKRARRVGSRDLSNASSSEPAPSISRAIVFEQSLS